VLEAAALLLVDGAATEVLDAELEVLEAELEVDRTEALEEELEEVLATTAAELVEVFTDEEATTDVTVEEVELLTVEVLEVLEVLEVQGGLDEDAEAEVADEADW